MKISESIDSQFRRKDHERLRELDLQAAQYKEVWDAISVAAKSSVLNSAEAVTVLGTFNKSFDEGSSCWIKCDGHVTSLGGHWYTNFGVSDSAKPDILQLNDGDRVSVVSNKFVITSIQKIEGTDDVRTT